MQENYVKFLAIKTNSRLGIKRKRTVYEHYVTQIVNITPFVIYTIQLRPYNQTDIVQKSISIMKRIYAKDVGFFLL